MNNGNAAGHGSGAGTLLAHTPTFPRVTTSSLSLASAVVQWQASHGRNHLPWQQTRDPYRVWLSEIMLQQTQVSTVLGYYDRFLQQFPDVASLAAAHEDAVLALWSGLGYYSRARNLHKCAQAVMRDFGGQFPRTAVQLATLPGIGRSTAAAISGFCFGERAAILDANVKRVLTRVLAFGDDLSVARNEKTLWALAEDLLPTGDLQVQMPRYTQGLMDLGATVCLPRSPNCLICPVQTLCKAAAQGNPQDYPVKTRKTKRSTQAWWLLVLRDAAGHTWLQRRPSSGIWAGLYAQPAWEAAVDGVDAAIAGLGAVQSRQDLPAVLHVLTHRDLFLHPVVVQLAGDRPAVAGDWAAGGAWFSPEAWPGLGLPAPVRRLLESLE